MKRVVELLIAIMLAGALVLSGCAQPAPAPAPSPAPAATPAPKAAAPTPASAPAPEKVFKWRFQAFSQPVNKLYHYYLTNLVTKIKENTKGRIEATLYQGGALVPVNEILKSVANGTVEMGYTATGYHIGFIPVVAVADGLPMAFRNHKELLTFFFDKGFGDVMKAEYAKNGVRLMTIFTVDPYVVLSKKPLRSEADWRGVKIRGWGIFNKYLAKLGASPVDMAVKDVYMALAMGTVDGAITGVMPHYDQKHYEVCKFGVWPPIVSSSMHDLYINPDAWNALPNDLKDTLTATLRDWTYKGGEEYSKDWEESKANLTAKGVAWIEAENKAWMLAKAQELWTETESKDAPSAKAIKLMSDYLKELGAIK